MSQLVKVEGMHCGGCANSVKTKFESVAGVTQVEMNLEEKTATVQADHVVTKEELASSLEETTYEVVDITEA